VMADKNTRLRNRPVIGHHPNRWTHPEAYSATR
jgi:hypothetical protein